MCTKFVRATICAQSDCAQNSGNYVIDLLLKFNLSLALCKFNFEFLWNVESI